MKATYDATMLGLEVVKGMGHEELLVFCPYHSDSRASAEYNRTKGMFYCFGCGTYKTAAELAEDLGGELVAVSMDGVEREEATGESLAWLRLLSNPLAFDNEYLQSRRVLDEQVELRGIRANADGIIFPILDKFNKPVGAQIRHLARQPKYKLHGERTPVWPLGNLTRKEGDLFITEGVFGVLRAERIEYGNAVALMGASSVEKAARQIKLLNFRTPYAAMDSDKAGLIAAGKLILLGIPAIFHESGIAPDDWTIPQWEHVALNARELAIYDVNEVIDMSDDPESVLKILETFYWRLQQNE